MKFTTVFGVAALFMAPSAVAWKLPVSLYIVEARLSFFADPVSPAR
jgi:hypothetical protein